MRIDQSRISKQAGFTIMELMIATVVLSVVLLLATMSIMGVGRLYYKGQTTTRTQDTARNVMAEISRKLEFSGDKPNLVAPNALPGCTASMWCVPAGGVSIYAYCIGTTRYSFVLDKELGDTAPHVLWEDTIQGGTSNCLPLNVLQANPSGTSMCANVLTTPPSTYTNECALPSVGGSGKELLLSHMRLMGFQIQENATTHSYGLGVNVTYGDDDLLQASTGTPPLMHRLCKTTQGDQFCATSEVSTSITRRLR